MYTGCVSKLLKKQSVLQLTRTQFTCKSRVSCNLHVLSSHAKAALLGPAFPPSSGTILVDVARRLLAVVHRLGKAGCVLLDAVAWRECPTVSRMAGMGLYALHESILRHT